MKDGAGDLREADGSGGGGGRFGGRGVKVAVVCAVLAAAAGGGVWSWKHNRMTSLCILAGIWEGSANYLALKEKVFAGKADGVEEWRLASRYSHGEGGICLPRDDEKQMAYLEEAAARGLKPETIHLILSLSGLRFPQTAAPVLPGERLDVERSLVLLRELAEESGSWENSWAQHILSAALRAGWWGDTRLVDTTNDDGSLCAEKKICVFLDSYTANGPGARSLPLEKNAEKAEQLLEQAAANGFGSAVWELAWQHRYKEGASAEDYARAAALFGELTDEERHWTGVSEAKVQLAWMHARGLGFDADGERAQSLMEEALRDLEKHPGGKSPAAQDYKKRLLSVKDQIRDYAAAGSDGNSEY